MKKRFLILFCMAASMFGTCAMPFAGVGCRGLTVSAEETDHVEEIDPEMQDAINDAVSQAEQKSEEEIIEEIKTYMDSITDEEIIEAAKSNYQSVLSFDYTDFDPETSEFAAFVGEWYKIKDSMGEFQEDITQTVERQDTVVKCYCDTQFENGKVRFTVVFDFYQYYVNQTTFVSEIHAENLDAAADEQKSMGDMLVNASINTLLGMGTVFVMLIIISFIISLFQYIPKLFEQKQPKVETVAIPVPVVTTPPPIPEEDLLNDAELVAVIAAAIAAYEGSVSTDGFVVRSIRRSR